jgi:hypothetical protein
MNLTFEEADQSLRGEVVYRRLQSDHPKQLDHFGLMFLESWDFRVKTLTPVLEKCGDDRS